MEWLKRVLRRDGVRRFLCWLVSLYIRLVRATGAWTVEGAAIPAAFHAAGRPFILAFWHGRLLMMPCAWPRRVPIHMLISGHRDGRIIADAVRHFGIDSIAGSTTAGGSGALRGMVRHLNAGECVGITPDGPDGPAMHASSGIVAVARLAGASIVPLAYATRRRRILGTWDRFHLPFPFSRGVFIWGEPIEVPVELDDVGAERCRALIERRLNAITAEADRRVGRERVSPGTLSRQALRRMQRQDGRG
ncbi:MAG: lysophospholipid acyltransferase family protein [Alphaproteobacteria bacterium]|nr:lysophospholipid acyltransferase family protein [Alphaproteobacteria bacterium]